MNRIIYVALLSVAMLLFIACKKNNQNDTTPDLNCKVIKITNSQMGAPNLTINYNETDGSISQLKINDNEIINYSYSNDTIIAIKYIDGAFNSKIIFTKNNLGLITNRRQENDETGIVWNNLALEYNDDQLIQTSYTSSSSATPYVNTSFWSGGNLQSTNNDDRIIYYNYHTDKTIQEGDYLNTFYELNYMQILNSVYKNKNLLKSLISTNLSGDTMANLQLTYSFDANKNISAITQINGTDTSKINYEYECH